MIQFGRDDYGDRKSPLFAGQLNVATRRIPAGNAEDPGLFNENREVAGCGPSCQNLLFDLGLLDVLGALSRATGDPKYETARNEYLSYFFQNCLDRRSGYFPWGDHVGYDLAAALLGYALAVSGQADRIPPIRNPWGTMPW